MAKPENWGLWRRDSSEARHDRICANNALQLGNYQPHTSPGLGVRFEDLLTFSVYSGSVDSFGKCWQTAATAARIDHDPGYAAKVDATDLLLAGALFQTCLELRIPTPVKHFEKRYQQIMPEYPTGIHLSKKDGILNRLGLLKPNQRLLVGLWLDFPFRRAPNTHWLAVLGHDPVRHTYTVAGDLSPFGITDYYMLDVDQRVLEKNVNLTPKRHATFTKSKSNPGISNGFVLQFNEAVTEPNSRVSIARQNLTHNWESISQAEDRYRSYFQRV